MITTHQTHQSLSTYTVPSLSTLRGPPSSQRAARRQAGSRRRTLSHASKICKMQNVAQWTQESAMSTHEICCRKRTAERVSNRRQRAHHITSIVWRSLCETTCAVVRVSRVQHNGTRCVSYRKLLPMRPLGQRRHHHQFELADVQPPEVWSRPNCCCRKLYSRVDTSSVVWYPSICLSCSCLSSLLNSTATLEEYHAINTTEQSSIRQQHIYPERDCKNSTKFSYLLLRTWCILRTRRALRIESARIGTVLLC